jgi:hypothetical protein
MFTKYTGIWAGGEGKMGRESEGLCPCPPPKDFLKKVLGDPKNGS